MVQISGPIKTMDERDIPSLLASCDYLHLDEESITQTYHRSEKRKANAKDDQWGKRQRAELRLHSSNEVT